MGMLGLQSEVTSSKTSFHVERSITFMEAPIFAAIYFGAVGFFGCDLTVLESDCA